MNLSRIIRERRRGWQL